MFSCQKTREASPDQLDNSKEFLTKKLEHIDSLRKSGKTLQAIDELRDIKDFSYEIDENSYVKILYRLGDSYSRIGSPAEALPYFQALYDSALVWKDTTLLIHSKANRGILFSNIKDTSRALVIFKELIVDYAIDTNITKNISQGFAPIYNSMAIILKDQNRLDSSLIFFQKALTNEDQPYNKAGIYNNIGTVYRMQDQFHIAHKYCDTAIQIASEHLHEENLVFFLCNKVRVFTAQNNLTKSFSLLNQIEKRFDSSFSWNVKKNLLLVKIDYYKVIKDFDKALQLSEEYLEQYVQNHQDKKLQEFYNTLIENENERKLKDIQELKSKNEINRLTLQNQKTIILFSIIIITLLLISLIQIRRRHKKVNALNKSLVQKNLELLNQENKSSHPSPQIIPQEDIEKKDSDLSKTIIPHKVRSEILKNLSKLSKDSELLCNPQLNIDLLAKKYHTNQKYLSQIINEVYKSNFTSFINEMRIKESCRLFTLQRYKNYTIEAIANEVGFTNKATFNRAFKKYTQVTPSVFRQHCNEYK